MTESKIGVDRFSKIVKEALSTSITPKFSAIAVREQPKDWKDLQLKVKEIYSNVGCKVQENVVIGGGKTKHQIDVLATFQFGGQSYRIIVECKHWSSRVKKRDVGSLIAVLADIGAEKGVMVSKEGFQKGAYSLATYTNIDLLTFNELCQKAEHQIEKFRIQDALQRLTALELPFGKFIGLMSEEAEKINEFWYPSKEGTSLLGAISMLRSHLQNLEQMTFPRKFFYSWISEKEVSRTVNSRKEYFDLLLENLELLEKEYDEQKDKIFSE